MGDGVLKKISRVIFWRYRRGGWQYDILCILILLFIFLVPRSVLDGSFFKNEENPEARETLEERESPETPPANE
jgi:hypothetical protein